jgi:hypothetical protein
MRGLDAHAARGLEEAAARSAAAINALREDLMQRSEGKKTRGEGWGVTGGYARAGRACG